MIESRQNDNFKRWSSLLTSKGIRKHGQFLLFGAKTVSEAQLNHADQIIETLRPEVMCKDLFSEIDIFGTHTDILVLKTPAIPTWSSPSSGSTVLLPLGDPANLGGAIRSACALGVENIVLLKEAANPFHPKSVRAASGTLLSMRLLSGPSIADLKTEENWYGLDAGGEDISKISWRENPVLVVGEEGPGFPKDLNIQKIKIPMSENVESLNAPIITD